MIYQNHTIETDGCMWEVVGGRYSANAFMQFETPALAQAFIRLCMENDENPQGRPKVPLTRKQICDALGAEMFAH